MSILSSTCCIYFGLDNDISAQHYTRSTATPIVSQAEYLSATPSSLKVGTEISHGGSGTILKGELERHPLAVKHIHGILLEAVQDGQGDAVLTAFRNECTRLESIINPLIVGCKGAFHDSAEPILVMENMQQDLSQLLRTEKGH